MEAQPKPDPQSSHPEASASNEEIEEDEELEELEPEEEEEDEDDDDSTMSWFARRRMEQMKMELLFRRLLSERVPVRVHDVIIKGNKKTKDSLIEAEVEPLFRDASCLKELRRAAKVATAHLRNLGLFESVCITLDAGPPELPGTANVVIDVSEGSLLSGVFNIYSKPEAAASWFTEAVVKLKNLSGYGDVWDGSLAYGWGQSMEISTGVSLPRLKSIYTPLSARVSLLSQDWSACSSYKEQVLGLALNLLSTRNHDLSYNLSWSTLTDPSQMSSHSVRKQLGHNLISALKYAFKIDEMDSKVRPTRGHAFVSRTQFGGLFPDLRSLRFFCQEFDFRYAIPLGFYRAALNFGVFGGVVLPWGKGSLSTPTYLPERIFMGGNAPLVCSFLGPTSISGFEARGLGLTEPRRVRRGHSNGGNTDDSRVDHIGGDLALTAFADLSFDLPLKVLRNAGVHGHAFFCSGSLNRLSENSYRDLSLQKFKDSFRSSVGIGLVVPALIFRMEVNYCHILKKQEHDTGKSGVQFCFSI